MDLLPSTIGGVRRACQIFTQDLEAIPEDAYTKDFGGKSRTVADLVYETILLNDDIARALRGEPTVDWPEGWIKAPANLQTKAAVLRAFATSTARLLTTVESITEDQLLAPLATAEGETTRFERCRFLTLHVWYHSGQLNFIQTLLGDDEWHWT